MTARQIVALFKANADPERKKGMARYGINTENCFGVSLPFIRETAKKLGKNHELALELWDTGFHEIRMLAAHIADVNRLDSELMERWAADFDSWDICDCTCNRLFDKSPLAFEKINQWAMRDEEYVKRTAFVLMTQIAVHNKKLPDSEFVKFFPLIIDAASDERNFVKKAVNWAVRQIGKRNQELNKRAIALAEQIARIKNSKSALWIASDALRELKSEQVQQRLQKKNKS